MNTNNLRIEVRAQGVEMAATDALSIRAQLARTLSQFRSRVQSVMIRLTDLNGPRGGDSDVECRIVVVGRFPTIVISERSWSAGAAIDVAADRARNAVVRAIGRTRAQRQRVGLIKAVADTAA